MIREPKGIVVIEQVCNKLTKIILIIKFCYNFYMAKSELAKSKCKNSN